MSAERLPFDESFLKEKLKSDPTTWETRRQLAHGLYDKQAYEEAAEIIWTSDQIPSTDLDLAFAIRILAKAQPRRAIRLLTAVLELNQGKAVQNMAMANALLHHGMVLQAARFYGAALEADPTLVNPDLEHFVLWSDDECTMWDLFDKNRPKLGQLPWMLRDPKEALRLTSRISLHTTPIYVPDLPKVSGENLKHDLYQQEATHNAKITPPPAVTIPIDRVDPKDRLFDATYGASVVRSAPAETPPATAAPATVEPIAAPAPSFPSSVVFPDTQKSASPASPVLPAAAMLSPVAPTPAASPAPVAPESFPSSVVFPGMQKSTSPVLPAATLLSPVAPAPSPVEAIVTPEAPPVSAAPPEPVAVLPAVIPFFADLAVPKKETSSAPAPFFADQSPPSAEPLPSAESAHRAVSFLGDERLTGSVKIPAAPASPSPKLVSAEADASAPEADKPDTIKKSDIPQAFPISQSAVPTTVLRVKWSTSAAKPGVTTPPTAAPMPFPAPMPVPVLDSSAVVEPVAAPVPFAVPVSPPIPVAMPVTPQPIQNPAASSIPTGLPITQPPAPTFGAPTGQPTRALVPSGAPPLMPTGAPTRALLPSGTPPVNTTGAPTRVLLPGGTPPDNAGGAAPRRLLLTPSRPPTANQEGQ